MPIYFVSTSGQLIRHNVGHYGADSPLRTSAGFRGLSFKACSIASAFKGVIDEDENRIDHPANEILGYRLNPWTPATVGWSTALLHLDLRGDAVLPKINRNGRTYLQTSQPDRTNIRLSPDGEPIYEVAGVVYSYDEVVHLRALSLDGITGMPLHDLAAKTFECAINAEELARKMLADGYHLAGYIKTPIELDDAQMETMQAGLSGFRGTDNAGEVPIIPFGGEFVSINQSAADNQYIETRQFLIEEISRWVGVPQHILSKIDKGGYNSISQLGSEVVRYVLRYTAEQMMEELSYKLLTPGERSAGLSILVDLSDLERGNFTEAIAAANQLSIGGIASDNEVRPWVGLARREGGDVFRDPSFSMREADPDAEQTATQTEAEPETTPQADAQVQATPDVAAPLNGAQITAAVDVLEKVRLGVIVPLAAVELLIAVGLDRAKAEAIVQATASAPAITVQATEVDAKEATAPEANLAAMEPMIAATIATIERKTAKAFEAKASKPREELIPWANVFAAQQNLYVQEAMEPLNATLAAMGLPQYDAIPLGNGYEKALKKQASTGTPANLASLMKGNNG